MTEEKKQTDIALGNRFAPAGCCGDMGALCFCGGRLCLASNFLHRIKSYSAFATLYATVGTASRKELDHV